MKDLRSAVVKLVIGSFSIAALMGIVALLVGDVGETQGKVLLTTTIVGVASLATLCYLTMAHHRFAAVGAFGAGIALIPLVMSIYGTWAEPGSDTFWKIFTATLTISLSIAQICLLLAVAAKERVSGFLLATLAAITVLAALIISQIVDSTWVADGDGFWRLFGVVLILDVLGTVVIAASSLFRKSAPVGSAEPALLTPAVESRLIDAAQRKGTSPSELLSGLLDDFLN